MMAQLLKDALNNGTRTSQVGSHSNMDYKLWGHHPPLISVQWVSGFESVSVSETIIRNHINVNGLTPSILLAMADLTMGQIRMLLMFNLMQCASVDCDVRGHGE